MPSNQNSWNDSGGFNNSFNNGSSDGFSTGSSTSMSNSSGNSFGDSSSNSKSRTYFSPEAQDRLNQIYPTLFNQFTSGNFGGAPIDWGHAAAFPTIKVGEIWSPDQIQAQVNSAKAQNDQAFAGRQFDLGQQTVAKGYGANSPLYQELVNNLFGQKNAANSASDTNIRWSSAQGNAGHLLQTQQAAAQVAKMQDDAELARLSGASQDQIARINANLGFKNQLLQAMAYYNQPLSESTSASTSRSGSSQSSSSQQKSSNESGNSSSNNGGSEGMNWGTGGSMGSSFEEPSWEKSPIGRALSNNGDGSWMSGGGGGGYDPYANLGGWEYGGGYGGGYGGTGGDF